MSIIDKSYSDPDHVILFPHGIGVYPTDPMFSKENTGWEQDIGGKDNSSNITGGKEKKSLYQVFNIEEINKIYNNLFDLFQTNPQECKEKISVYSIDELETLLDSSDQELILVPGTDERYLIIEAFQEVIHNRIDEILDNDTSRLNDEEKNKLNILIEGLQDFDKESDEGVESVRQFIEGHKDTIKILSDKEKNEFIEHIEKYFPYNVTFLKKILMV